MAQGPSKSQWALGIASKRSKPKFNGGRSPKSDRCRTPSFDASWILQWNGLGLFNPRALLGGGFGL